jgi:hypothetical protein
VKHYFLLLLFICNLVSAAITIPYPETILLKQIGSAEKERVRHAQSQKKFDRQPTGFYIESGKTIAARQPTGEAKVTFTGYPTGSIHRILTSFGSSSHSWLIGHEIAINKDNYQQAIT